VPRVPEVRKVLGVLWVLGVLSLGTQAQGPATARDLVGTWTLSAVERTGGGAPATLPLPRGLLVFDAAGHAFELSSVGPRVASAGRGATPAEAHAIYNNYSGFWGSYRLGDQKITYRPEGAVSPNAMGQDIVRSFALKGDRLTIESAAGSPDGQDQMRWTWDRVPQLENLTPANRQLLGFWRHVVERRLNETTGAVINEATRAPSVIVYTPSGYVGVHFPPLNRAKFVAALPTDDEAQAAIRGFVSYYGAYTLYPGLVFHHRLMILGNGASDSLRRFYEIKGDELTLKFPPGGASPLGPDGRTNVVLKRISGAGEMLRK
jgi:lipocalin-like protein